MSEFVHKINSLIEDAVHDHMALLNRFHSECKPQIAAIAVQCETSIHAGGKLLFFGNGGSAADSQHFATELTVRFRRNRRAIAAIALTTDSSALTAIANDFDFGHVFSRQIEAIGKPGDIAIGITTSGKSENVLRALETATQLGLRTCALTSRETTSIPEIADFVLAVPSSDTARIQEMHLLAGHIICDYLEGALAKPEIEND